MIENPIFIVGTERSGSNLLRLILNSHPNISIPHPPHVMRDFSPIVSLYGDLNQISNFKQLTSDVKKIVENHFSPWPLEVVVDDLIKLAPSRSLYGLYVALYELYRQSENKKRFGCKSTFMFAEIETILAHHQNPKFIHLVRDPRDVAVSASKSIFSKYHPYKLAELWFSEQAEIKKWHYLIEKNQMIVVRYEDLVRDPAHEVSRIMNFLGEDFKIEQLDYFKKSDAQNLAKLSQSWRNVQSPVNNSSVGQYKKKLTESELMMVEAVCNPLMRDFSYECSNKSDQNEFSEIEKFWFDRRESLLKWQVEFNSLFNDKNFFLRWKKKLLLKIMEVNQIIKNGV